MDGGLVIYMAGIQDSVTMIVILNKGIVGMPRKKRTMLLLP